MAGKKKQQAPAGAPEWMVTYGDMMGLLLCFFVVLVSMSELKQNKRFQDAMESIRRAFGYQGGIGFIAANTPPANTNQQSLLNIIMRKFNLELGQSADQGIEGEYPSVKTVREGLEFTLGGRISFEMGKARLLDRAQKQLDVFAETVQGLNTKIRIRGHTAQIPARRYEPFASLDELSYARGVAVKDYLISRGIQEERITVEACGANEPLRIQAYDDEARAVNDRVSIIVTETLIETYKGKPDSPSQVILDR